MSGGGSKPLLPPNGTNLTGKLAEFEYPQTATSGTAPRKTTHSSNGVTTTFAALRVFVIVQTTACLSRTGTVSLALLPSATTPEPLAQLIWMS